MKIKLGLSDVYEHYIDANGNKYFPTYNTFYGEFVRQVQTKDGLMLDASGGEAFKKKMLELGFAIDKNGLFSTWENRNFFVYQVYGSETGIPNKPKSII